MNIYELKTKRTTECDFVFSQGSGYKGKILTRILVSRSEIDLAKIKQEYQSKFGKSLYQDIQVNKSHLANFKYGHHYTIQYINKN